MTATVADQIAELIGLANQLYEAGKAGDAEEILVGLAQIQPDNVEVLKPLGVMRAACGAFAAAIAPLARVVELGGGDALVCNVLSVCHFETGGFEAALAFADRALALAPRFVEARNSRGNALLRLGRAGEALAEFRAALAAQPRDADLYVNAANALRDLQRPAEALASLDRAVALAPGLAQAHANRGDVLQDLGRHEAAIASYDRAVALAPDWVDAHWNRSLCNLRLGRFEAGWRGYEWRFRRSAPETRPRDLPMPSWRGEAGVAGKTVLLHCEQGFGDSIQFARLAGEVKALGARVVLEAYPPLIGLFRSLEGVDALVARGEPTPAADFHCPLMSLPLALGGQRGAPESFAPYLRPSEPKLALWRERLGASPALRVGVVCSGSPTHRGDAARSLPLSALAAALPAGAAYHLLQKDLRPDDRAFAARRGDLAVWSDAIADFDDSAALCQLMDLVVSVDTSTAHLAGALGRPLRILLPHCPDWRWGLKGEATPWYPTAALRRQARAGDWSDVLASVRSELEALIRKAA
jgi:tetratricopeptide (TPR) repeat protein